MGLVINLFLFKPRVFQERVLPALQAFAAGHGSASLVGLLQEAAEPAPRARPEPDREVTQKGLGEAIRKLVVGPASDAEETDLWAIASGGAPPGPSLNRERARELAEILRSGSLPPEQLTYLVETEVADGLIDVLCIPWDEESAPVFNLSHSPAYDHVRKNAPRVGEALAFGRGAETLEISADRSVLLLKPETAADLVQDMRRVAPPQRQRQRVHWERLLRLLGQAAQQGDVRLAIEHHV